MIDNVQILSAGRSGSTLLNMMLGSHSRAIAVGEITHLPKNVALNTVCTCGAPVRECELFSAVLDRLGRRLGFDLQKDPYALELGFINASRVVDAAKLTRAYRMAWKLRHGLIYYADRVHLPLPAPIRRRFDLGVTNTSLLYEEVRAQSGAAVVVDASKVYLKALAMYEHAPERTRLILLCRDGRAVMSSNLRSGDTAKVAVRNWKNYHSRTLAMLHDRVPREHVLQLRYEDLAADPRSHLQRLCDFLGLPFEEGMLDHTARRHHIANGNDMRLSSASAIVVDARWQSHLQAGDRAYFERHAGELNRLLGYS